MVKSKSNSTSETRGSQGLCEQCSGITKINASTPYDFEGGRMTPFGGLLPVATMLEKLRFQELLEKTLVVKRETRVMSVHGFVLAMLLLLYIGYDRLNHVRHLVLDPIVTGILGVMRLPGQSTFWRFLQSLQIFNVKQWAQINREMRERVWQGAKVELTGVTVDTDTTVETLYGSQQGARKSYNPKNKGKRSYQPILSFIAETGEFISGSQRKGDNPTGKEIAKHLEEVFSFLPSQVRHVRHRTDAGFYCIEAIQADERRGAEFIIVARKTSRLLGALEKAKWRAVRKGEDVTSFFYQPQDWPKPYRFVAIRYPSEEKRDEQYQLFETDRYIYRVFVTNMKGRPEELIDFYDGRAGAENLIKESKNDAGLASVPSRRFIANMNFFWFAMLAYNLNRWLSLFSLADGEVYKRTMLSTQRMTSLFVAAKITRHSRRTHVRFQSDHPMRDRLSALMQRLRRLAWVGGEVLPVFRSAFVVGI